MISPLRPRLRGARRRAEPAVFGRAFLLGHVLRRDRGAADPRARSATRGATARHSSRSAPTAATRWMRRSPARSRPVAARTPTRRRTMASCSAAASRIPTAMSGRSCGWMRWRTPRLSTPRDRHDFTRKRESVRIGPGAGTRIVGARGVLHRPFHRPARREAREIGVEPAGRKAEQGNRGAPASAPFV
jgi:hypothetical protein